MACFARIDQGTVIAMHVLADDQPDGANFLSALWGGDAADYVLTPEPGDSDYPGIGWTFDPVADAFMPPAASEVAP